MKNLTYTLVISLASLLVAACGDDDKGSTTFDAGPGGADAAGGGGTTFNVTLTKAAEVPMACAGAGATAMGSGTVTVSSDNSTITVNLTYSGLSGAASAGHLHCGSATAAGGVAIGFSSAASPVMQTLTATNFTAGGAMCPATFAEFVTMLKAGNAYANFHTAACPGGEIRGQITP